MDVDLKEDEVSKAKDGDESTAVTKNTPVEPDESAVTRNNPVEPDESAKKFDKEDQYGYTKVDYFTSEIFKIEIKNCPRHYGYGNWKKLFKNKLKIPAHKIQVLPHISKVYVTFKNNEDREKAIQGITGMEIKGCILEAKVARPKKDAMAKKRESTSEDGVENKIQKLDEDPQTTIKNSVTPWWNVDYDEQLKRKEKSVVECLQQFNRSVLNKNQFLEAEIFSWLMERKHHKDGVMCDVLPIIPSPCVTEYRNKCSFTIGNNLKGDIVIGNRLGKYRDQNCAVETPENLEHVPQQMKVICKSLQDFVIKSDYSPYNRHSHEGYWQEVVIRNNTENHNLVIVNFCKQELTEEQVENLKKELKKHVEETCGTHTLLFSATKVRERSNDAVPLDLIIGEGCLYEKLLGFNFRISPRAFFQCNTRAAEVLYKTIEEMANHQRDTASRDILLDICCGTGTIGICMSKSFDKVYGIDMNEDGIKDARLNAQLNGVTNVEFHVGKAENEINRILKSIPEESNIVAVVDPPRSGVHPRVIGAIRSRHQIKTLVYVSCSITQTQPNVNDLVRNSSKKLQGPPFKPLKCRPVDLFPHTKHVEVVTLYQRLEIKEENKESGEKSKEVIVDQCKIKKEVGEKTDEVIVDESDKNGVNNLDHNMKEAGDNENQKI